MSAKKLYRLRSDRVLGGVCSGLARYFNIDVAIVRIITFLAIMFGGLSFWLYVIAWILIPEEPADPYYNVPVVEDDDSDDEW